jgi:hypothetical protein
VQRKPDFSCCNVKKRSVDTERSNEGYSRSKRKQSVNAYLANVDRES